MEVFLSNCATLKPPDGPVGRELKGKWITTRDDFGIPSTTLRPNPLCDKVLGEKECGYFVWTISDRVQYVGEAETTWLYGKPWSRIKDEGVLVPSEMFAQIKSFMVKMCKKTNCDKEIPKWKVKLDALDSAIPQPTP